MHLPRTEEYRETRMRLLGELEHFQLAMIKALTEE